MSTDVLILWRRHADYFPFFRERNAGSDSLAWDAYSRCLLEDDVSWPGALTRHMNRLGLGARLILVNDRLGQHKWAAEQGFEEFSPTDWEQRIAMAQVAAYRPKVLWIGSLFDFYGAFVRESLSYCGKVITWMGSPFLKTADVGGMACLLTENPSTLKAVHDRFERVIVTKPGFAKDVLDRLGPVEPSYPLTFVGGLSRRHMRRLEVLRELVRQGFEIDLFGYINDLSSERSMVRVMRGLRGAVRERSLWRLRHSVGDAIGQRRYEAGVRALGPRHHGPVFGIEMLRTLAASRITLNVHIDVAGANAGNMRMVEATGVGACLVTEEADNIAEMFVPGREVVTYAGTRDLSGTLRELLRNPERVAAVARAGQVRTFREHTIERMFEDIKPALDV